MPDSLRLLANLLYPNVYGIPGDLEERFPLRQIADSARVTRFAPSPTGFLHIGGLYTALISRLLVLQSEGVFYLRIEDTDKKREVQDGVSQIIRSLADFGITFDEGPAEEVVEERSYGPYKQSERAEIYNIYARALVERGLAYPCFCSEQELEDIKERQLSLQVQPGYYGEWAIGRHRAVPEMIKDALKSRPYVVRLKSVGGSGSTFQFSDLVKGDISMPVNEQDIVLLKTDGLPTYHFAHVIDDHLMRTTHVIRGDEWLSSMPIHLQLHEMLGFEAPAYGHIAPILKMDGASKRKLSKRKDPEAAVTYYRELGFPKEAMTEYLLGLANWNFEDWRKDYTHKPVSDFTLDLGKMNVSGALFDMNKLIDISKDFIAGMRAEDVYVKTLEWAQVYDPELFRELNDAPEYVLNMLRMERGTEQARKDISKWSEIRDYLSFFFDETYKQLPKAALIYDSVRRSDALEILQKWMHLYDDADDKIEWFSKMKELALHYGFAPEVKLFKKNPGEYKGHVGDVSMLLRKALTGKSQTPDLYEVMKVMGPVRVEARLQHVAQLFESMETTKPPAS
jgi:glutamyl-tRNA synthetase